MPRLLLVSALVALGLACTGRAGQGVPMAGAAGLNSDGPAAPPASNAEDVVRLASAGGEAEAAPDPRTAGTFSRIMAAARAENVAARPYGEIVQWAGERLLGEPYVAGLLDAPARETLVVNLHGFDCVLYVENVLALARTVALETYSYDAYVASIEALRYRDGRMDGYCSRLHYFSDWIADNEARGTVQNVTAEAGGVRLDKQLTFMTANRPAYPHLASADVFACVQAREADLHGLDLLYVPQDRIAQAYPHLQAGDVIATATSIGGLDVTHTGFVHRRAGARGAGFMHASLAQKEVVVSDDLARYVQGVRNQTGIIVARPLDPRL